MDSENQGGLQELAVFTPQPLNAPKNSKTTQVRNKGMGRQKVIKPRKSSSSGPEGAELYLYLLLCPCLIKYFNFSFGLKSPDFTPPERTRERRLHSTIVRDKKRLTLKNTSVVKRFKVVYNKHVLLSDFTTLPLGTDMGMDRSIQGLRDVTYFDFRLQHPFSCVISGPSNSGKTFFVKIRTKRKHCVYL